MPVAIYSVAKPNATLAQSTTLSFSQNTRNTVQATDVVNEHISRVAALRQLHRSTVMVSTKKCDARDLKRFEAGRR